MSEGSIVDPMTLSEALTSPRIQSGHTVYLRGGVYTIPGSMLTCTLAGTAEHPITIRNYPGEIARIRCWITQQGAHVRWLSDDYGLVIENVVTDRVSAISGSVELPTDIDAWHGFTINADDVQFINVRIENVLGAGVLWFRGNAGLIYGLICSNNGWVAPDRDHGPGVYSSNPAVGISKTIENCIFLNTFRYSLQLAHTSESVLNYSIKNVIVAGNQIHIGTTFVDNLSIDGLLMHRYHPRYGFYGSIPNGSMQMVNSIIDSHDEPYQYAFEMNQFAEATVTSNVFSTANYINNELEGGAYIVGGNTIASGGAYTRLVPNAYAPNFATLTVFDFGEVGIVTVNVSSFAANGTLRVHNPMLWAEYHDLTITGGNITLPLTGWTTPLPTGLGEPVREAEIFSARFGCFVLERLPP